MDGVRWAEERRRGVSRTRSGNVDERQDARGWDVSYLLLARVTHVHQSLCASDVVDGGNHSFLDPDLLMDDLQEIHFLSSSSSPLLALALPIVLS